MKFSIVIPVYNVYDYLDKCLNSLLKQSYDNFEVIIVNDGSPDNSQEIIDKYQKLDKRFKGYIKENGGLSSARNYGLKYVKGDYLLFIDSDDFIEEDLLLNLNNALKNKMVDIVRFNCVTCDTLGNIINKYNDIEYLNQPIDNVINDLTRREFFEPAWLYCYKVSFWKKNNFKYTEGRIHEDFGLTPLVLYYAKDISAINYDGYYYVMRDGSITKTKNYDKIKKGVEDTYMQYVDIVSKLADEDDSFRKKVILSYLSECLITKINSLTKDDKKKYYKKLRTIKVTDNIYGYNFKKKIKKMIAIISFSLYSKIFK